MPEKGQKSLPVYEETHRRIKVLAASIGIEMRDLVRLALDAYEQGRGSSIVRTATPQEALLEAILRMEDIRRILMSIANDQTDNTGIPGKPNDFAGAIKQALRTPPAHSETARDLGTGTGRPQPASWRKLGPHGKRPGPTRSDPT